MSNNEEQDQTSSEQQQELYHERQRLALCGVHAVNNLMQRGQRYTKSDFDAACVQLTPDAKWFNPHRSCLGIGNYDVNVVTVLLQQEGFSVQWHDQRKALTAATLMEHEQKQQSNLVGILWNVPSNSIWGRLMRGRHWIALLYDNNNGGGEWINLDSGLDAPKSLGTHDDCVQLLNAVQQETHILLVSSCSQH